MHVPDHKAGRMRSIVVVGSIASHTHISHTISHHYLTPLSHTISHYLTLLSTHYLHTIILSLFLSIYGDNPLRRETIRDTTNCFWETKKLYIIWYSICL